MFALTACVKPRYALGAACATLLAVRLGVETVAPLMDHSAVGASVGYGFAMAFLGPSALPMPRSPIAAVDFLGRHRVIAAVGAGVVAALASALAFRRSRPLRPETAEAYAWDRAGLRFLFVAVVEGMIVVLDLLMERLMRDV